MFRNTRLILNLPSQPERFEQEFRERLYTEKGREIVRAWEEAQKK